MKKILGAVLLICALATAGFAAGPAGTEPGVVNSGAGTSIRSTAVVANADTLSTTFTVAEPRRAKAIHYYINFTKGSLTDATFTPAGAVSTALTYGPAASGYAKSPDMGITVTATGYYHIRVPIAYDGATTYHGLMCASSGTTTSSDALVTYKLEY